MAEMLLIQNKPSCTAEPVKGSLTAQCIHHWVIEPPTGPVSKGVCKKCGEEKEFDNICPLDTQAG